MPPVLGDSPAFLEDIDPLGPVGMTKNADAEEVEPSGIDAHERGGMLAVVDTEPPLAEGTASIEPASGAERATAARPEALGPGVYDKAGRRRERLPQDQAGSGREIASQEMPTESKRGPVRPLQKAL